MASTIAFAASLVLVVVGVALVTIAGGFIVAGALLCALTVLHERGSAGPDDAK